jgi:hypothetical protein
MCLIIAVLSSTQGYMSIKQVKTEEALYSGKSNTLGIIIIDSHGRQNTRDVPVLIPRTHIYVVLYGKWELVLQVELRLLIHWLKENILHCPGPDVITGSLNEKVGSRRVRTREMTL